MRASPLGCLLFLIVFILTAAGGIIISQHRAELFNRSDNGVTAVRGGSSAKTAVPVKRSRPPRRPASVSIIFRDAQTGETVPSVIFGIDNQYSAASRDGTVASNDLWEGPVKIEARAPGYDIIRRMEQLRAGRNALDIRLDPFTSSPSSTQTPAYLTIDDGPDPRRTPKVLDILEKENVPATFFVVGRRAENEEQLIRRMYVSGHTLGNHTYTHEYATLYGGSVRRYLDSLRKNSDLLAKMIGYSPKLTRPPGGEAGNFRAGWGSAVRHAGYRTALWNVSSGDGTETTSLQMVKNVKKYLDRLGPREAPIILTHDVRPSIIRALPKIIGEVRRRGYEFEAMPDTLGIISSND